MPSTVDTSVPPNTPVPSDWRPPRTGAGADHQRQHTQHEGQRGHQDGAQALAGRLQRGIDQRASLFLQFLGKLDDQDAVLGSQTHRASRPTWK